MNVSWKPSTSSRTEHVGERERLRTGAGTVQRPSDERAAHPEYGGDELGVEVAVQLLLAVVPLQSLDR